MYSPVLGRFLQPDPIGYLGGTNLYAYVRNDPLNSVDPAGLFYDSMNPNRDFSSTLGKAQMQVARQNPAAAAGMAGLALGLAAGAEVVAGVGGAVTIVTTTTRAVEGGPTFSSNSWSVALKPQNFTSGYRALGGGTTTSNLSGAVSRATLDLSSNPLAGTIERVGIAPPTAISGSEMLDPASFVPQLGSRLSNSIQAAAVAAAGLIDVYQSPGDNGAASNLNANFSSGPRK